MLAAARLVWTAITCSFWQDSWMQSLISLISFQCGTLVFSSVSVAVFHSKASISQLYNWLTFCTIPSMYFDRNLFSCDVTVNLNLIHSLSRPLQMPNWVWHNSRTGSSLKPAPWDKLEMASLKSKCCIMAHKGPGVTIGGPVFARLWGREKHQSSIID